MGKRIITWKNEGSTLFAGKAAEENELCNFTHSFNLEKIVPTFTELTLVQKYLMFYGVKQALSDCGSSEKDFDGKMVHAEKKWDNLCKGVVSAERANGTGAAENKQIASAVKAAMKEVTLQGLLVKQLLTPGLFTEDDNAKLQEFLVAAGQLASKNEAERKAKR